MFGLPANTLQGDLTFKTLDLDVQPGQDPGGPHRSASGCHHVGEKFEAQSVLEGGGFGVGSDSEFSAGFKLDWKPVRHVGLTGGYNYLRFKFKHEVASKTLEATQTLSGPVVGIGLYFWADAQADARARQEYGATDTSEHRCKEGGSSAAALAPAPHVG
jgi:hypothetical protein